MASSSSTTSASATLDIFEGANGDNSDEIVLEGKISGTSTPGALAATPGSANFNTLDEPIRDTLLRDVRAVGQKFYHVLYPVEKKSLLREWDLWGPLILCTFMATILQGHDTSSSHDPNEGDGGPEFAEVFVIVWIGALIVTLNTKLLGGHISFFQSVCVLGYCLLPLSMSLVICRIILFAEQGTILFLIRALAVLAGFIWSTFASMKFLGDCQPERRKILATYPMFLFYFLIGWMVISHSN